MIVGGTSGMGLALAKHYLERQNTVAICGRDICKFYVKDLQKKYPELRVYALDVAIRENLEAALSDFVKDGECTLDLLIVTAGTYFNSRIHPLDSLETHALLRINVSGLNHAFELASHWMLKQQSGHLVAVSSIAGLLNDYPGASAYSATKRAVLALCDCYRKTLAPFSIAVTAIVPGYVDTERLRFLNDGDASHKPFIMSESRAVEYIVDAIDRRQLVRIFPWQMRLIVGFLNIFPLHRLFRRRVGFKKN
jgi:short-subunit dehydrogenase